jgi:selenocysteine-specific elongation factor
LASQIHRVIVGTAGHIDHGKSTLVTALTGIDPDRLAEEKARGMTIDLGFAPYVTRRGRKVGIIDVPGHERFVKNMVAGASSVDLFLLVVAADDGVMPQTREHVEILGLLGARQGIVVITKIDLVDADLRELAIGEIEQFLIGTPFEHAPRIGVSATTGEGMDALRDALDALIEATPPRGEDGVFRMPIQRVFSARGQGTVVTGVPVSGHIALGDVLEILPLGERGKVRAIQAYKEEREDAAAGHSTAINVSDVDYRSVTRGMVAATPGYFAPARRIEARLRYLASATVPLRHGADVRLHVGTAEVLARLVLLDERTALEPGAEALVQFRLREPVVVAPGDRFLIRLASPMITLGGGVVVAQSAGGLVRSRARTAQATERKSTLLRDRVAYFEELMIERGVRPTALLDARAMLALPKEEADPLLGGLVTERRLRAIGRDKLLAGSVFDAAGRALVDRLAAFHAAHPLATADDALRLRTELRLEDALFDALLVDLVGRGEVEVEKGGRVRLRGAGPRLSPTQRALAERIDAELVAAGVAPPGGDELAARLGAPPADVAALLRMLAEQKAVWKAGDFCFALSAIDRVIGTLATVAREGTREIEIPQVRDALGTTRKYLIPLLESLDAAGITQRRGDKRYLVRSSRT